MWGWLAKVFAPVVQAVQTVVKAVTAAIGGTGNGGQARGGAGNSNPGSQAAPLPIEQSEAEDIALIRERQRRAAEQKRQAAINKKISNFNEQYGEQQWDFDTIPQRLGYKKSVYLTPASKREFISGSILNQDIDMALRHEQRPKNVSEKDHLKRFARSGWDEEETEQAKNVLAMWDERFDEKSSRKMISSPLISTVRQENDGAPNSEELFQLYRRYLTAKPDIDQSYVSENNPLGLGDLLAAAVFGGIEWTVIYNFALEAESKGFDDAGRLLKHFLFNSGTDQTIDVDKMLQELPLFQQHVTSNLGYGVGSLLDPNNAENAALFRIPSDDPNYSIYSLPLGWSQVGLGGTIDPYSPSNIYGSNVQLPPISLEVIRSLQSGQSPVPGVPQEVYDWYLAVNKFNYYPTLTMVIDNRTGEVQMSYSVVMEDRYAWYVNPGVNPKTGQPDENFKTGTLDYIMATLDATWRAQNFAVMGESSVMTIKFNLGDCVVYVDDTGQEAHFYNFSGGELPQYVRDRYVRECNE